MTAGMRQKKGLMTCMPEGSTFVLGSSFGFTVQLGREKGAQRLDSHFGPCPILEKLGEVVFRVQWPQSGTAS